MDSEAARVGLRHDEKLIDLFAEALALVGLRHDIATGHVQRGSVDLVFVEEGPLYEALMTEMGWEGEHDVEFVLFHTAMYDFYRAAVAKRDAAPARYKDFVRERIDLDGLAFHPDTPFTEYVQDNGNPVYVASAARALQEEHDTLLAQAGDAFDPYRAAVEALEEYLAERGQ